MEIRNITEQEKEAYDAVVGHPLQAYEWGEFREKTGVKVIRRGFLETNPSTSSGLKLKSAFQLTIHKIPHTPWTIGYLPKGGLPDEAMLEELVKIGKQEKCIFIQLEPNVVVIPANAGIQKREAGYQTVPGEAKDVDPRVKPEDDKLKNLGLKPAAHPLFTKYTFVLDLTKSEDELLRNMHPKARYNIKVAQKHGVEIKEDNSDKAFEEYLRLTRETTERQKFYAHTPTYHRLLWNTLRSKKQEARSKQNQQNESLNSYFLIHDSNKLSAHLLTAKYQNKTLTTWVLFVFKDTLYYPYGASSSEHREVMASNLMMWEGIKFGKKLGLKKFDMWGALSPDPDKKDPWYGFHNFKEKYGPEHVEFTGSYDLVISPLLYKAYKVADKLRWIVLKLKK